MHAGGRGRPVIPVTRMCALGPGIRIRCTADVVSTKGESTHMRGFQSYTVALVISLITVGCDPSGEYAEQADVAVAPEQEDGVDSPPADGPETVRAQEVDPESGLLCVLCILGGNDAVCGDDGENYPNSCFAHCAGAEVVDEQSFYPDADGDGFGDADAAPTVACAPPAGTVDNAEDCADDAADVSPGQAEVCDDVDNDCDASSLCVAESCADVADEPGAVDGEYTLYIGGDAEKPWTAYCVDLAGEARTYLTLVAVGSDRNFAQYTAGGAASGTDVRTVFTRVRIDPSSLLVDIDDLSFASSTGQLQHGGDLVTAMPYGAASSCDHTASGVANVDLTGTPFKLADPFCTGGFQATGGVVFSQGDQVADVTGGGYCGWSSPDCTYGPHTLTNGSVLDLAYVGP